MKMNKNFYSLLLFASLIALGGCKKEEVPFIEADANLYFGYPGYNGPLVSSQGVFNRIYYSFGFAPAETRTNQPQIWVTVTGNPVDYDRPFSIKIVEDSSTAIRGKDYEYVDTFTVKANELTAWVPFTLLRSPELTVGMKRVYIQLVPGKDFKNTLEMIAPSQITTRFNAKAVWNEIYIDFDDIQGRPRYWTYRGELDANWPIIDILGTWSKKKMQLLHDIAGMPLDFFQWTSYPGFTGVSAGVYRRAYSARCGQLVKEYMQEQAALGTPVLEDDGTPMYIP